MTSCASCVKLSSTGFISQSVPCHTSTTTKLYTATVRAAAAAAASSSAVNNSEISK